MWDADTFVPPLTSGATDTAPEITFDLGSVLTIGTFEVWNFGTPGFTGRGVNAVRAASPSRGSCCSRSTKPKKADLGRTEERRCFVAM